MGKPTCTENHPCGCHFGETFHADSICACMVKTPPPPHKEVEEKWEKEFDKEFSNPNTLDSSAQFNPKYSGKLYQSIKSFIKALISKAKRELITKADKLIQHPPVTRGESCVCMDLDEWEKFKLEALKRGGEG